VRSKAAIGFLLLFALPVFAATGAAARIVTPQEAAAITINLADLLANEPGLPLPVRQRREGLDAYYQEQAGTLLWIGTGRMAKLVARLKAADNDGLDPATYPSGQLAKLAAAAEAADARSLATIELFFSAALLQYASDLKVGRFLPRKVDPNFFQQEKTIDPLAALNGLGEAEDVSAYLDGWQPKHPDYAALKRMLGQYRAIAKGGGWPSVPMGAALKPGMSDARVPALRARLAVTDGPVPAAPPTDLVYDEAIEAVVQGFQARHGIDPDGVVGNATVAALNAPVERRIDEIVMAMERWRWMPDSLGPQYLMVNIAAYELKWIKSGKLFDRMEVVVGKPYSRTPVFSDALKYVEFNPYWNVPFGIAIKEQLPTLRRNPQSLAATGFEAVRGGRAVPLTQIDWSRYGPNNFPYQIRQRPGAKNALGEVKFVFPNRFDVYLHDTPSRSLFKKTDRAFSHGCIRLSRPLDLAEEVLADVPGWDRRRIDRVVVSGQNTVVHLPRRLPIHITYLTAWVENGRANFRSDIYKHDEKLLAALTGRDVAW
jgi:murein L,D-transpeptidase YcbB/YkuD